MANHAAKSPVLPTLTAGQPAAPPEWALWQRKLLDTLQVAAREFVAHYTRPDGTLPWRTAWPGMDGSDDPYEGFWCLPLLYLLGGDADLLQLGYRQWEAVTWQWTEYGQIYREYDAYYDWMHHGEASHLFHLLCQADPTNAKFRQRAVRFARFYTGDDPTAPNYDPVHKLLRSPLTGSRGPRFTVTAEDWQTHRENLDLYPPPFEDIPGVEGPTCPWSDDTVYQHILERMNARMNRGDVPLNLTATGLVTHAYLLTGDERYRQWVLDYKAAWAERAQRNGGLLPDNVGLDDIIGQYMDGKWWGGYYGWRWPHGAFTIIEPAILACCNAVLLTGDRSHLQFARSQFDELWKRGKDHDGTWLVPYKHGDNGWSRYKPFDSQWLIYCWYISQDEQDLQRILHHPERQRWQQPSASVGKATGPANTGPWFQYMQGQNPHYPVQVLRTQYAQVLERLAQVRADTEDPASLDIHHWQNKSPLICEGLFQLMLGAPYPIYHGGLLMATLRYFDGKARRPGLPQHASALVEHCDDSSATVQIVNMDAQEEQDIVLQAGGFGEHTFHAVTVLAEDGTVTATQPLNGKWLQLHLPAGAAVRLRLRMSRFTTAPSYLTPWISLQDYPELLQERTIIQA